MRTLQEMRELLINRFREIGIARAFELNSFGYLRETDSTVIVKRENGNETVVSFAKIEKAIDAVRQDQSVYNAGPRRLREFGITHVNSPVYAILHLMEYGEFLL